MAFLQLAREALAQDPHLAQAVEVVRLQRQFGLTQQQAQDIVNAQRANGPDHAVVQPRRNSSRLSNEEVRRRFERYGYVLPEHFVYTNVNEPLDCFDRVNNIHMRLSVNRLRYLVSRGRQEYNPLEDLPLANAPIDTPEPQLNRTSYQKWLSHVPEGIQVLNDAEQHVVYDFMQSTLKQLSKRHDFTIRFGLGALGHQVQIKGFIEAIKIFGPRIRSNQYVRLTFINVDGVIDYKHISPSTIRYLDSVFNNTDIDRIKDSNDDLFEVIESIQTIKIEFKDRVNGKRKIAGFFPYINKSDIDLRRYGIFSSLNDPEIHDSCLLQAFKYSNTLTEEELKMLSSFIKDRYIPQATLREIAELFGIHINCRTYYMDSNKSSHEDYYKDASKHIKLIILNKHYMLNECVTPAASGQKALGKLNIVTLIKRLINSNKLIPMTDKQINTLEWGYTPKIVDFEGTSRPIIVRDKRKRPWDSSPGTTGAFKKVAQTKHFFGYDPINENINQRLYELQDVINKLPLRHNIDVSLYYKFSELMKKIMYEYGCFDGVNEYSGSKAKKIRDQCIFPKMGTPDGNPLYMREKLFYIDLNGAYMAAVKNIPSEAGTNNRIKSLIQELYAARMKAKTEGNDKLATTLKFLMNSCWGYSIRRPKLITHKYTADVKKYIETYGPDVVKYTLKQDGSGFVTSINPFVQHFSYPQFAKSVLDEFNSIMDNVKSIVDVLYQNVDAILIRESDYNKLMKLGYIGNKLGQFKIEHIFTEIAIMTKKKYMAILDNGEVYHHCVKKDVAFEDLRSELQAQDFARTVSSGTARF